MICPACGAANEDGVLFCEKCKADLEMPAAARQPGAASDGAAPGIEEPIPLEPIALEPIFESTVAEPVAATLEEHRELSTTVEQPVVESKSVPPPLPSTLPQSTIEQMIPTSEAPASNGTGTPKLIVVRGQKMDMQYPIYPGKNYIGRTDDKPVDIDLDDQEAPDRIWSSRQHAVITFENGSLAIEDLNSLNGTFVNRTRVHPGQVKPLQANDVVQVGTVHMKVVLG